MASELSVQKGVRALLSNVSLTVNQGDVWQLAGGNGVGKTSLLRAFARLARIEVFGRLERCEDVLYSGHSAALKGALTPRQNLMTHPSGLNAPSDLAIDTALEAVGVLGHADVQTARLSAGQKRRVALARLFFTLAPPFGCLTSPLPHSMCRVSTSWKRVFWSTRAVAVQSYSPVTSRLLWVMSSKC